MPKNLTIGKALQEIGYTRPHDWSAKIAREPQASLRGSTGVKAFNEMRLNSAVAGAALFAIESIVRKTSFYFESDMEADDERVEFLGECWDDMSRSSGDTIADFLTMLPFGWAYFETLYKRRLGPDQADARKRSAHNDGRIGWRQFALREQITLHDWAYGEDGSLTGMIQHIAGKPPVLVPIGKSTLFRTKAEGNNPEGVSILRHSWFNWYFTKTLMEIEAIGIERQLTGLPKLTPPEGADLSEGSADRTAAEQLLRRVRNDEEAGVLVPPGWEFELMGISGAPSMGAATGQVITRHETRIAMSMLAQFLVLGLTNTGSYSLASTQADLFLMALNAFTAIIADTFSRFEIPRILRLNGMSLDDMPRLTSEPIRADALSDISAYFATLSNSGMITPDNDLEQWFRGLADAPLLPDDLMDMDRQPLPAAPDEDEEDLPDDDGEPDDEAEPFAAWPRNRRRRDVMLDKERGKAERRGERALRVTYRELRESIRAELE